MSRCDPREHGVRRGQRLEREDPRLRVQSGGKQRELAAIGADIDHARKIPPGEGAHVFDGRGDAVAQPGTKAAVGYELQQLARAACELGRAAGGRCFS